VQHRYADIKRVRLDYVKAGVLFLHGFPKFWYEWRKEIPEFAKDHLWP
jgi:pimeloyl-ACP methyl ester carboxylesterase